MYNRIVKKLDNLSDYDPYIITGFTGINFNPNDGVRTTQVINYPIGSELYQPDYCLIVDDQNNIVSRWFVAESRYTRALQLELSLVRDVIVDWYDDIVSAPCFIEKAMLGTNNPLIFNNEEMTYNQIKQYEKPITDNSRLPWYAIYVNSDFAHEFEFPDLKNSFVSNITVSSKAAYAFNTYNTRDYIAAPTSASFGIQVCRRHLVGLAWNRFYIGVDVTNKAIKMLEKGSGTVQYPDGVTKEPGLFDGPGGYEIADQDTFEGESFLQKKDYVESFATVLANVDLQEGVRTTVEYDTADILSQDGLILFDESEQKFYRIHVNQVESQFKETWVPANSKLYLAADSAISDSSHNPGIRIVSTQGTNLFFFETTHPTYRLVYEELAYDTYSLNIPSTRMHTEGQPYDILLVPDGSIQYRLDLDGVSRFRNSDSGFANRFISAMLKLPDAAKYIIDIQKLPYTPLADNLFLTHSDSTQMFINQSGSGLVEGKSYAVASNIDPVEQYYDVYGVVFFANQASFKKQIKRASLRVDLPTDPIEFKVANECDKYRIVSPNFNGQFEFSATKNGGITGFDISCTMIPYQPYIKVAPIFNNLYGQSFNDARGMICAGDFSVARTSSEWIEYKKNNKNYQEMFNRQIENMEVNNSISRTSERIAAIAGTVSGAGTGAATGMLVGGGYGAAIGGVIGGAAAGVGGLADLAQSEKLRREALDYTKDQFGFKLQNIQAIPYNITKLSSFTEDYKDFPILEYYTCTEIEKEALRSKIQYNGMTVGTIGYISTYILTEPTYIKAKLIRLENIAEDFHVAEAIARELNQGVFI